MLCYDQLVGKLLNFYSAFNFKNTKIYFQTTLQIVLCHNSNNFIHVIICGYHVFVVDIHAFVLNETLYQTSIKFY